MKQIDSIEFKNLSFAYPDHENILTEVNFNFPMNKASVLRGAQGVGRSALLQVLAGINLPTAGSYIINNEEVSAMSFEEFLPYRLRIGYSFDLGGLISNRTIFDNLILPLLYHKLLDPEAAAERVNYYLKRFDILKFKDERPAHVSGGVRKTAILIRSIIHEPDLVLLDDPTLGISKDAQQIFGFALHELRKRGFARTLVLASYDERFNALFDPVDVFMEKGTLALQQSQMELAKVVGT